MGKTKELAFNAEVPEEGEEKKHFAAGLNVYKLLWVYYIGGIAGFLWETVWCLFRYGNYQWRSGMAFTPINPVYGMGAVVLYLTLYKVNKKNYPLIFLIGVVGGTAVELFCSYFQEYLFGAAAWNYSHMFMNFEGRICLGISLVWGVFTLAWTEWICPVLEKAISIIPDRIGKVLTWVLLAVVLADAFVTVSAMVRWTSRRAGDPPKTFFGEWLDAWFPDKKMHFLYPSMQFVK